MGLLAQVLRFVMAFNAQIKQWHGEQLTMLAPVHVVAGGALPLDDRRVAYLLAEITCMTGAAGVHQVRAHAHLLFRMMALAAFALYVGGVKRLIF